MRPQDETAQNGIPANACHHIPAYTEHREEKIVSGSLNLIGVVDAEHCDSPSEIV